ncbi:amino acid permease [Rhodococcus sp. 05-2256-B1]|uniref:APC family permease n=1 Tax=unclassified Rhodococcus (in: high G+C Gram-positive bacteria) TaxID=192944 RepID=UPI000B9BFD01|nr:MULTISPECIES: amino acid permease [unclassified Rhodococcus (in: high G+C Gram-positive bacteria)]OZD82845.1 amino acid permease [Rhodococcus sp. 05-2256-B4]OZD96527.1 amino acid permease [Rhodococcus sp. 05-2256-B3]OZD99503.1 amino acid permease [Rhodococcus sp. 05-2256-B1]
MGMFRTKSVDEIESDVDDEGSGSLRKQLGLRDLVGFGVGIVIGTGIFTLTGVQAKENAGPAVVISFVIAGVVSLLAALCYAELASAVPTAGSAYTYAYATLGELFAWIIGWDLILEFALGAAVVARSWSGYLADLFSLPPSLFTEEAPVNVGAVAIVAVLGVVAAVGVKESARVTNVLVLIKVAISVFIVIAGLFFVQKSNLVPFVPESVPAEAGGSTLDQLLMQAVAGIAPSAFGFAGVVTAAAVVFFAYTGFEAVANLSEEAERPAHDLPRALIGTLVACTLLYMMVAFVVTGMVKYTDLDDSAPIAKAFDSVGAGWAGVLVSIAAVAGLTSVILVELVTICRIGFAMGRDGLLPKSVAKVSPRFGTPTRLTVGVVVFVALLGALVPLKELAEMVSIGALFAFLLVSAAVPILRRTKPDLERPFRVPLSPVVPILSGLSCVYLMANLVVETWIRFLVWLALGLLIYFAYGRRNARLATEVVDR